MINTEILKLKSMLEEANIPFEFTDDMYRHKNDNNIPEGDERKLSYSIVVFSKNDNPIGDAIYTYYSHGFKNGLLEIHGELTEEELMEDSIKGYLTAEEVFRRFKYCYDNETKIYLEKPIPKKFQELNELMDRLRHTINSSCGYDDNDEDYLKSISISLPIAYKIMNYLSEYRKILPIVEYSSLYTIEHKRERYERELETKVRCLEKEIKKLKGEE